MRGIGFSRDDRSARARWLAAVLVMLLAAWPAQGFRSLSILIAGKAAFNLDASGHVHGELTRAALCALNLRNDFVVAVVNVNWRMDWDSNSAALGGLPYMKVRRFYRANKNYKPDHHFDRNKSDVKPQGGKMVPDHVEPFRRGVAYLQSTRRTIVDGLIGRNGKDVSHARVAMGQALHAMQDFFSHSNVTDLPEAEWNQVMRSLELITGPIGPLPATLKITGFDKDTTGDFEKPDYLCLKDPLSPYGHDACAKDEASSPESKKLMRPDAYLYVAGKTKFVRASEAAIEFSKKWLLAIKAEVGATNWKKIEDDGSSPCQLKVIATPSPEIRISLSDFPEFEAFEDEPPTD